MAKTSKAKRSHSMSLSGELNLSGVPDGAITITEILDDRILTYDISEYLQEFDGKKVTWTIKEDGSVEPTEEEESGE